MTSEQKDIHERALRAKDRFQKFELEFIRILQDVERTKLHRAMGVPSVYVYAVDILGFTESVAYMFIAVARKSLAVPQLMESGLSVFKSSRLVAAMTPENADELIRFAQNHTTREVDSEMARRNPKARPERIKVLSEECVEMTVRVSKDFAVKLKRLEALRAQKNLQAGIGAALEDSLDESLRKHDPVEKARRAAKGNSGLVATQTEVSELCAHRVQKREPLTTAQKHAVFVRDEGKCTHTDASSNRCGADRWVQIHHLKPVAAGGTNEPENLTTLCSFHHDLVHQLSFPLEGQVTWLRSPVQMYG